MSFLPSTNHLLAADLWSENLQPLIKDLARHPTCGDRRRSHLMVYKTLPIPGPSGVLYPVSVRVYGFLERFSVGDFGNWDGDCAKAACAVQSLSISGVGNAGAWRNQLERLNLAATFASHVLKIPLPAIQFRHHIHMQRKVFTKAHHTTAAHANPPVNNGPQNVHLPKLPDYPWQWNGPLEILECNEDGTISPIHEVLLSWGDFVEIDAEFDLVIVRTHAMRTYLCVFLTCKQVLRLQTAQTAQHSSGRFPSPPTEVRRMRANTSTQDHDVLPLSEPNLSSATPPLSSQLASTSTM
ncbi:hypothetical protein M404DRAFT_35598 [Pisolithus tinctorius Marx 270]|uniref:Uncharacterized protein n=1 Tax=Pisolithus tinctorius Marx 270 TaxID=870435 RepID=A0A0C3MYF1_PISTI|nr:hypothetical protein M404DRAFT_35598 [Pisolithus tinctorius Marx 270]